MTSLLVSPSSDERVLEWKSDFCAKFSDGDGAEAVEDEQDDEGEEDGARVEHDALRPVKLHLRDVRVHFLPLAKLWITKQTFFCKNFTFRLLPSLFFKLQQLLLEAI